MNKLLQNKKLEINICNFIVFIIAIGIIGAYFVVFQLGNIKKDFYAMKLITYVPLFLLSAYTFLYSVKNNEKDVLSALSGVIVISALMLSESFCGALMTNINCRMVFKFLSEAFAATFTFALVDHLLFKKTMLRRVWYCLISCILLIFPAVFIGLYWFEATRELVMEGYVATIYFLHAFVCVYTLIALILDVVYILKYKTSEQTWLLVWSNIIFSCGMFLYALLSILNIIFQGSDWIHMIDGVGLLVDVGLVMIVISSVYKHKSFLAKGKKHK